MVQDLDRLELGISGTDELAAAIFLIAAAWAGVTVLLIVAVLDVLALELLNDAKWSLPF